LLVHSLFPCRTVLSLPERSRPEMGQSFVLYFSMARPLAIARPQKPTSPFAASSPSGPVAMPRAWIASFGAQHSTVKTNGIETHDVERRMVKGPSHVPLSYAQRFTLLPN